MSTVNHPPAASSNADSVSPHVINQRYRVIRELATGPMGELYLAEDLSTRTQVTVRILGSEVARDEKFVSAVERHGRRLAALCIRSESVAKVCGVHQVGETGVLIAMERVEGKTLTELIQADGALPVGRALCLAIQIARGLEAAHALGFVHRGLTPDNIAVTDTDEVKLMDFGLAELLSVAATKQAGSAAIAPEYLAPEQLDGGEITEKTDIYALGTVLYQTLSGVPPFTTAGLSIALAKRLSEPPALPAKSRRNVAQSVERIIRMTLAPQPDRRPEIAAVIDDLEREQHRLHQRRVRRDARVVLRAVVEGVTEFALTARQSTLTRKLDFTSCGPEERERLERFLQWRQRTGRARPTGRPTKTYLAYAATAVLGSVGLAAALWIASGTHARQHAASTRPVSSAPAETPATDRAPREPVAAKSPEWTAPLATHAPIAVAPSLPPAPSRDVLGAPPPLPPARPEHVTRASVPRLDAVQTPEASAPVRPVHVMPATDSASRAVAQAATASPETPSALGKRIETLKHLAGYLPEVRIAKAITAWVKTQPPPDGEPRAEPPSPQTP